MSDCVCFADAVSCDFDAVYSCGIENTGVLVVENCAAYGTHSGLRTFPNSVTWVQGGTFEGIGHGGIYLSHTGGQAFIQDAEIVNARYRGNFKTDFDYSSALYHSAGLYFGGTGVSNSAAYLDNCRIFGSNAEAIIMRNSSGEQNNTLYLSNCDIIGSGMRIDSETHKIYVGKACHIQAPATLPDCVVETDAVYWVNPLIYSFVLDAI